MPDTGDSSGGHLERFFEALEVSASRGELRRLVLSKPKDKGAALQRVDARPVELKGAPCFQLVERHATRDVTRNVAQRDLVDEARALVPGVFLRAHLQVEGEELQLMVGKRGQVGLHRSRAACGAAPLAAHDRAKRRHVDPLAPFLRALGVTDAAGSVVPAMARKYKQIDKFVEVLEHALVEAGLLPAASGAPAAGTARAAGSDAPLRIVDFGAGKGYLTFAVHEHLRATRGVPVETVGVELRQELVDLCNRAAADCGAAGLSFARGDVATFAPGRVDVMIALHACDTATDHALHLGLAAGARVLVCSPCCHKELRPQVATPSVLAPLLRHGVHLGQEAEMLTDGLRALLVEAEGYDAKVFEFVSLEHTSKNKMLVATRRDAGQDAAAEARRRSGKLADVAALKAFYGVAEQRLERLLAGRT